MSDADTRKPSYYITTPIYYVNDRPHIGHAYTTLACDVLARFKRLDGYDVHFLTGTDEHGQKVEKSAEAAGIDPLSFCDRVSQNFRDMMPVLKISNDDFIRTTEQRHVDSVQALWRKLKEAGDIYLGSYAGWYAVRDEAFYGEDELTRTEDGRRIAPSGAEVEWVEEPSYFFRLSAWGDRLLAFYDDHPDFILPAARRNEVVSFVKSGLRDLSISRTSFNWGVPVPDDEDHVMYVWLDALTNYITAIGHPETGEGDYPRYWPADVHMVGKDILRFHAVYWPAFLMSAGLEPPKRVFAHGWWTIEGQKMSKSLGNAVAPEELVETYGLDQTRYFLLREVPFGNDGDFSRSAMVHRVNGDLSNDLGNLSQRVLSMVHKNCDGAIPVPGEFTSDDRTLLEKADTAIGRVRAAMDDQALHRALGEIWDVIGDANRYVDAQAPWALKKQDPERMKTVLYVLADLIRQVAILVQPVMPDAADAMLAQIGVPGDQRAFQALGNAGRLSGGTPISKPVPIFPRYQFEDGDA
ncbi:methionine--tRNA ligase [Minwuia sp.]|uniref:methionine--tRNA ligase n=1 Tax=Minwuia sp. TaxID=2493630 RepID=UPI003A8F48AE